ncbi:CmcI family methyltransferase [Humidesulfovibrio idahonensis]
MAKIEKILLDLFLHPVKSYRSFERSLIKTPFFARRITKRFHQLYYGNEKRTWGDTKWMGVPVLKCPLDLWIYQEILFEVRPDVLIECGTASGGSTIYFANLFDLLGNGKVVTIDINDYPRPKHARINYLLGSSTAPEIFEKVKEFIKPGDTVMVVLDSDHSKQHVLNEMLLYSPLVSKNSYLTVEDSNQNGNPVSPYSGPGPMEAIEEFMATNREFKVDDYREKFYLSFNPKGYLKRIA